MTDKTTCIGILNNDFAIQLNDDSLYIRVRGGPQTVKYRLDDQPPSPMRLVSDVDRKIGVFELSGADFSSFLPPSGCVMRFLPFSIRSSAGISMSPESMPLTITFVPVVRARLWWVRRKAKKLHNAPIACVRR